MITRGIPFLPFRSMTFSHVNPRASAGRNPLSESSNRAQYMGFSLSQSVLCIHASMPRSRVVRASIAGPFACLARGVFGLDTPVIGSVIMIFLVSAYVMNERSALYTAIFVHPLSREFISSSMSAFRILLGIIPPIGCVLM